MLRKLITSTFCVKLEKFLLKEKKQGVNLYTYLSLRIKGEILD